MMSIQYLPGICKHKELDKLEFINILLKKHEITDDKLSVNKLAKRFCIEVFYGEWISTTILYRGTTNIFIDDRNVETKQIRDFFNQLSQILLDKYFKNNYDESDVNVITNMLINEYEKNSCK